eukprot:TRINITY_DN45110_c0_g1_i1.p1 TRINITY_DN45110_c0_g1~~TRINITY_DN45110_c0_g1_i1.p1  ORF type:complete len:463 (+),score=130.69 TRINITY_DN45110_c0_g1_i1:95-1483(+)
MSLDEKTLTLLAAFAAAEESSSGEGEENDRNGYDEQKEATSEVNRLLEQRRRLKVHLRAQKSKHEKLSALAESHLEAARQRKEALKADMERLSSESQTWRRRIDKGGQDNANLVGNLAEETRFCDEARSRMQFLYDRIVSLLAASNVDSEEVSFVCDLRSQELEVLRQIEETQLLYEDMRQQNGELHNRVDEELHLSRRLAEQLEEEKAISARLSSGDALLLKKGLASWLPEVSKPRGGASSVAASAASLDGWGGSDDGATGTSGESAGRPRSLYASISNGKRPHAAAPKLAPLAENELCEEQEAIRYERAVSSRPNNRHGELVSKDASAPLSVHALAERQAHLQGDPGRGQTKEMLSGKSRLQHASGEVGLRTPSGALQVSQAEEDRVALRDRLLCQALGKARFENAVSRIDQEIYCFGGVRAAVLLEGGSNRLVASLDGDSFLPIDDFLGEFAKLDLHPP